MLADHAKDRVKINRISIVVFLFFSLTLQSCNSSSKQYSSHAGIPPVASQVLTQYSRLETSREKRPVWLDTVPDDSAGLHYMIGISDHYASEREARSEAMRDAREQYAKYTGVDIEIVDEVISSLYGKSSDILDATINHKTQSTHESNARVSRIKAKEWYFERYQATRNNKLIGSAWKYWVQVTVPVDEYQKVQEWKAQQIAQVENKAANDLQINLDRIHATLASAKKNVSSGNIMPALTAIYQDWNHLYKKIPEFTDGDSFHKDKVAQLEQAQDSLTKEIGNIRSQLFLDTGRFSTQRVSQSGYNNKIKAWVWVRTSSGNKAVSGLPLVLSDLAGTHTFKAISGPNGLAEFLIDRLPSGQYKVAIDPNSGSLALLGKEFGKIMGMVENRLTVIYADTDMRGSIQGAIQDLFSGSTFSPLPAKKVTMGPVTHQDTGQGTSFSHSLQQLIRQQLTSIEGLGVVEPRPRNVRVVANAVHRVRGIALQQKKIQKTVSLGSAAMQAAIDGAEAALEVNYTVHPDEVWVEMQLKEAGTDILKGASTAVIAISSIPQGLELVPQASASVTAGAVNGEIKLEVTSHLGDGQTYLEGDTISYFASTNQDSFLLFIYEDAEHNLIQILPNRFSGSGFYKAGNYLEIPGPSDRFQFMIKAPFGLERLWAFAASKPFPVLPGREARSGLKLLSAPLPTVLDHIQAHGKRPDVTFGEAQSTITTVSKKQAALF